MNTIKLLNEALEQKYHLNEAKEDKERFKSFVNDDDLYNRFEILKSKQIIKGQDADYTYWEKQSVNALKDFIEKTETAQEEKNKKRTATTQHYRQISDLIEGEDYNLIYKGNGWTIYNVLTHKASMWFGKDTKWCITMKDDTSYFNQYKNNGANYYFLIPDKNPETDKWCYLYYNKELNLQDAYFVDSKDYSHTIEDVDIPDDVLLSLPGISQNLIDYTQEKRERKLSFYEIEKEVQRTGVYTYNPLDDNSFIQKLKPKKIIVPDSVKEIEGSAFYNCKSLQEITLSNSIEKIGDCAFVDCTFLKEIILPNSIKEIGNAVFGSCRSLQKINIPDSVKKIGYNVFIDCTSLQEIVIPNSVKEIGEYAFRDCTSLQEINLPNNLESIGGFAFYKCSSLQKIHIPNSVKEIRCSAFEFCTSLQEINLPNSVKEIGSSAFEFCTSLQEINLPNSVEKIDYYAFENCDSLQEINLPNSVEKINSCAFYGCESLQEINIKGRYRPQIFEGAGLNNTVIVNWADCDIKETYGDIRKQLYKISKI